MEAMQMVVDMAVMEVEETVTVEVLATTVVAEVAALEETNRYVNFVKRLGTWLLDVGSILIENSSPKRSQQTWCHRHMAWTQSSILILELQTTLQETLTNWQSRIATLVRNACTL
jgi:hypothetical protein